MLISASLSSIASSGQTPTQQPQKSHLSGRISIISNPVLALRYSINQNKNEKNKIV